MCRLVKSHRRKYFIFTPQTKDVGQITNDSLSFAGNEIAKSGALHCARREKWRWNTFSIRSESGKKAMAKSVKQPVCAGPKQEVNANK